MTREYRFFVYILMNSSGTSLYIGVTNNLERRVVEHASDLIAGFSKRYKVNRLVYFEEFQDIHQAISREKQLKAWRREKKDDLIRGANPHLRDLSK